MPMKSALTTNPPQHQERAGAAPAAGCHHDHGAHHGAHSHATAEGNPKPAVTGGETTEYTCPMHPQVRQAGPGNCPICGMALEPVLAAAEPGGSAELRDMSRRFWLALMFTAPVFALEMGSHLLGLHRFIAPQLSNWVQLALATPVVGWAGWPFFVRAVASVRNLSLNMFSLVALGTGVAWSYSLVATLVPQAFPAAFQLADGAVAVYFEAAAVITLLVLLGQVLELRAREKTSGAIRALLELVPKTAVRLKADGSDETVPLDSLQVGDRLRVRPGEKVPVDGELTEGRGTVDESLVTGEPMPVAKTVASRVTAGTLNQAGSFVMRAERVGADTLLSRIVDMVATAQRSRAPIQRMADQVAGWFVPVVIAVAALTFMAWLVWGPSPSASHALFAAVAVLIIACPCALGLATPASIIVGVGRAARGGVLIRDAEALECMEKVDTLLVDKTGTLTEGKPKVVEAVPAGGFDAADLLQHLASVERASEHPLAAAIVEEALRRGLELLPVADFESPVGKGVVGVVGGVRVACGSGAFLAELDIPVAALQSAAESRRARGDSVIFVAIGGRLAGYVAIADPVKRSTGPALAQLRQAGIRLVMLTGNGRTTAEAVGRELGIDEVVAEALPQDKAAVVKRLQAEGRVVAMAGDGVNDAPGLAAADVGIAMGGGTDVAMESAGVTLLRGDLMGIVRARQLSRATMRNIRQNLFLSFAYNVAGIPLAAGLLYPFFGVLLSPQVAAAAMALSSVSVIANALRLRTGRLES
ncbi:Silver exporting P-type ATPase [Rubrivivax sp. A210]|uniref:copper-transporting P-type ATPase n=1 Tax=Rubrivivax sp. A210 TaxID=2772301 RepID=UPI00191ADD77|nr:copper-translocating P-type ATPase [Rubrivivax sp. A210]CAD5372354.1 Silver exporting P-type ATPase [Rubrivivax sp. A210]